MDYFQDGECLGPFREGADAAVDVLGAHEGDEEEDAAEDGGPEDGAHEVVYYEVVLLPLCAGAAIGGLAGIHLHGLGNGGGDFASVWVKEWVWEGKVWGRCLKLVVTDSDYLKSLLDYINRTAV